MLIESVPREPLSFHLVPYDNPRLQHTLQAKTLEQKREWCKRIKKHILDSYNVPIPDKAKELLLNLTGKLCSISLIGTLRAITVNYNPFNNDLLAIIFIFADIFMGHLADIRKGKDITN